MISREAAANATTRAAGWKRGEDSETLERGRHRGSRALEDLRSLSGRFLFLRRRGAWFVVALLIGAALRALLVWFSEGTLDVSIWEEHARSVLAHGAISSYHGAKYTFNHPPPAGWLAAGLWRCSVALGLPFAALLRAPFALLDAGTTVLLIRLLAACESERLRRARHALGALYWLCPLSILFSAYHGNTDSAVAFFILASTLLVTRGRAGAAGALLGLGLWIKIPVLLATPVLVLALPGSGQRLRFAICLACVGICGFGPALLSDAYAVLHSVFFYPGLRIQTTTGVPIWGLGAILPPASALSPEWQRSYRGFALSLDRWNTALVLLPIGLRAWLCRERRTPEAIAAGIADGFVILYGFSGRWAFQYLAWSLPFWSFKRGPLALTAFALATLYVYGLYAWLCGDFLLLGHWDFIGKPDWPLPIRLARNASVLVFFVAALIAVGAPLRTQWKRWRVNSSLR